jgi:CelD/BcsL family acetyltransferase involved in cellulose biosynthesis
VFSFYQSGFDPGLSRASVGLVTLGLTIRQAIDERAETYDLLHGSETYKFLWTDRARELVRLELYPPDVSGGAHRAVAGVRARAGRLVRRALRRAAPPPPFRVIA